MTPSNDAPPPSSTRGLSFDERLQRKLAMANSSNPTTKPQQQPQDEKNDNNNSNNTNAGDTDDGLATTSIAADTTTTNAGDRARSSFSARLQRKMMEDSKATAARSSSSYTRKSSASDNRGGNSTPLETSNNAHSSSTNSSSVDTDNSTQQDDRLKQKLQKDATERSAGAARMDGLQEKDDPSDANTNADEIKSDPTPVNPLFASQDVDDKRLLYNRFNNHNETTECDESLADTAGDGQKRGTGTDDDNGTITAYSQTARAQYDDDENSVATRPPSHPDSKYVMDINRAEQDSLRSAVGAFAVGRRPPRVYAGGTGGVANNTPNLSPGAVVSSQLNGHSSLQHQNREDLGGATTSSTTAADMPRAESIEQSLAGRSGEGMPLSPQEEPQSASNQAEIDDQPLPSTATTETNTEPVMTAHARRSSRGSRQSSFDAAVPEAVLVEGGAAIEAEPIDEKRSKMTRIGVGSCIVFLILLVAILAGVLVRSNNNQSDGVNTDPDEPEVGCKSCIDRASFTLRAIVHGTSDDYFWQRFVTTVQQSANDMRVNLQFQLYAPGEYSPKRMSDDIRAAVVDSDVDALIVTIPSSKMVVNAVRYAAETGMPIFGMNSGFNEVSGPDGLIEDGSVLFWTAMNETLGGVIAASHFIAPDNATIPSTNYTKALYITPLGEDNSAYQERFEGYSNGLADVSNGAITAEWFKVDLSTLNGLGEKLLSCSYQSVLVGTGRLAYAVVDAVEASDCPDVLVGTFDTSADIHQLVDEQRLLFAMDQQYHLQAWSPVALSALYLQAGLVLAPPPGGVYLSGPKAITTQTQLDELSRICAEEAYPVCGSEANLLSSECPCTERREIKIGGVVHNTFSPFWDAVFGGAEQAARDYQIELDFVRFEMQDDAIALYEKMAEQIRSLCDSDIDGLFVSITDDVVVEAVRECIDMGKPIISINAGYQESKDLGLIHHIGMLEEVAGYDAGREMVKMATFSKAACLNHWPLNPNIIQRCTGFERAMEEAGIEVLPQISVPADNNTLYDTSNNYAAYKSLVEKEIGESGNWDEYGFLLPGAFQISAALALKKDHPGAALATFDTNEALYDALENGDILFGIDQQPYLQGYLPIPILTNAIASNHYFLQHSIKTGPTFVITRPPHHSIDGSCEHDVFTVCE